MKREQRFLWRCVVGCGLALCLSSTGSAAAPQTFTEWAAQLPAGSNSPTNDADSDGLVNLVEYAFGLNPLQPGREGLPQITATNGTITYSFTRPKSVVGVEYLVRVSQGLTNFSQVLPLSKVSETATNENWIGTLSGQDPNQFIWSSIVRLSQPELTGHAGASRPSEHDIILPYDVQAAFNNDTFFWRLRYPGNEGKRHDYWRFTNGAWRREGGDRRDAQATLDKDHTQGETNLNSTIYEQRTSIMISDPTVLSKVVNFDKFACFLSCHSPSRHMPEWTEEAGADTKYIDLTHVSDGGTNSNKVLDLWHWRGARSNPIWKVDDQYIQAMNFTNSTSGDDGGRKGDAGTAVFANNSLTNGNPSFVFNPATTGGKFAPHWEDFWATPLYYIVRSNAANLGPNTNNPVALEWTNAVAAGYTPTEGDTVPARILSAGVGSRADITAFGTQFIRETSPMVFGQNILGMWDVQMQRALQTGNDDDVQLVPGNTYHAGFEVHLWEYTTRDHYVSFPVSFSLGPGGNIEAVDLRGAGADGSGTLPDWSNTNRFPVTRLYLFQPGISTWEFLAGTNSAARTVYRDPVTGTNIDQVHGGAAAVASGSSSCASCHKVREADPDPPLLNAGSMEILTRQRGGVWAPTPVLQPQP